MIGESPTFIEISEFEFVLVILLIVFTLFVLHASIWGLWDGGTQ